MQRFRSMKTLQKFSSVHAQVHNHFNQERHLVTRQVYKQRRSAALAEWSALAAFTGADAVLAFAVSARTKAHLETIAASA